MSGLYATLNSSVKAITAHSRAIETAGKNLANVNNTTYARQRVIYGDRGTVVTPDGAESLGLEALGVQQMRDQLLDLSVSRETSRSGYVKAQQSAYQRAQAGLGQSIDRATNSSSSGASDNGLGAALDNLFNSFQSLAASPTDPGVRASLLQNANILTDRFKTADQRLDQVQKDLDAQVNTDVASVNKLLDTLADLNSQIGRFEINAPGTAVDLRDQRQAKLEELAAKLPVTVVNQGESQIQLVAKDGAGNPVVLVDHGTVSAKIAFDGTNVTAGTTPVTLALASGSIQGALDAKTGPVQTLRNDLNALASQVVTEVNKQYNPTGATGDFFLTGATTAGTIKVDPSVTAKNLKASDGGAAGDNGVAQAVAALVQKVFTKPPSAIDGTFTNFYSKSASNIGQALATANAGVDDQGNIEKLVRAQRDSLSGVSLDEEMADLMKFQRAFQASSRVFNVVDELLDNVVNRLGV